MYQSVSMISNSSYNNSNTPSEHYLEVYPNGKVVHYNKKGPYMIVENGLIQIVEENADIKDPTVKKVKVNMPPPPQPAPKSILRYNDDKPTKPCTIKFYNRHRERILVHFGGEPELSPLSIFAGDKPQSPEFTIEDITSTMPPAENKVENVKDLDSFTKKVTEIVCEDYLYIATTKVYSEKNLYKIGRAKDIKTRLSSLNTSRTIDDKIVFTDTYACVDANVVEKYIHYILSTIRIDKKREYFEIAYDLLSKICECVVGYANNNPEMLEEKMKNVQLGNVGNRTIDKSVFRDDKKYTIAYNSVVGGITNPDVSCIHDKPDTTKEAENATELKSEDMLDKTRPELLKVAKEMKLKGYSALNKKDLIDLINKNKKD